jgi:ferrochelatase
VCDHIEVLYDLDREAAEVCREIGLPMVRAAAVNDNPLFLDMMADVVLDTIGWYQDAKPLPIVADGHARSQLRNTARHAQKRPR